MIRLTRGLLRPQVHALRLGIVVSDALLLPACKNPIGEIDLSGPFGSTVRVHVENATPSEILISYQGGTGQTASAGQTVYPFIFYFSTGALPSSDWFYIQRQSVSLARVVFRPLRYPETKGDLKDSTIVIREPAPGQFSATAAEPDWIQILSVTQPP